MQRSICISGTATKASQRKIATAGQSVVRQTAAWNYVIRDEDARPSLG